MELFSKYAIFILDIFHDFFVVDLFRAFLELLECQLFKLVHDAVETILVDQASG